MIDNKPVINIPGPLQAVLYGMDWCIRAIVNRLLHKPMPQRQTIEGVLTEEIKAPANMEILCMMDVNKTEDGYEVKQKAWRGGTTADALGAGSECFQRHQILRLCICCGREHWISHQKKICCLSDAT